MTEDTKRCPFCGEEILAVAIKCKHCRSDLTENKSQLVTTATASAADAKVGFGRILWIVFLVLVSIFLIIFGIGFISAIVGPVYQDYTARSRMDEAEAVGREAAESVANYSLHYHRFPISLEEAGYISALPPSIKEIGVIREGKDAGTVWVTMGDVPPIQGKKLLLVPSLDANNQITWKCMSQEIPDRYLSRECKQQSSLQGQETKGRALGNVATTLPGSWDHEANVVSSMEVYRAAYKSSGMTGVRGAFNECYANYDKSHQMKTLEKCFVIDYMATFYTALAVRDYGSPPDEEFSADATGKRMEQRLNDVDSTGVRQHEIVKQWVSLINKHL